MAMQTGFDFADGSVYQLKIRLDSSRPPIWRSFQVRGDISLRRLHDIIQIVMGWEDCHLHEFIIDGQSYIEPDPKFFEDGKNEKKFTLEEIVREKGSKFKYIYDFGDRWKHTLRVENILPAGAGVHYPVCLKGKRACPPEDSGGIYGYMSKLGIMNDPQHMYHEDVKDWMGEDFDPEDFSAEYVNVMLGA